MLQLIDLLLGGLIGRVDLVGAKKLGERSRQIAACMQHPAAVDVADPSLKPRPLEVGLIGQVFRIFEGRLAVVLVGGIEVLARLRILATLVPLLGRLCLRRYWSESDKASQQKEKQVRLQRERRYFND